MLRPGKTINLNKSAGQNQEENVNNKSVVEQTLSVNQNLRQSYTSLQWGLINAVAVFIISYDMSMTCYRYRTYIYNIELILVIILSLNTIYHFSRYVYKRLSTKPVPVTNEQKKLLGFKENDSLCQVLPHISTPKQGSNSPVCSPNTTPLNMTALSWRSLTPQNDSLYSVSSPSWVYYRGSPDTTQTDTPIKTPIPDTSGIDFIKDEKSLNQYLRDYETHEKALNASVNLDEPSNLLSSFWNHPATRACHEASAFLKNSTYQIASQTIEKLSGNTGSGHPDNTHTPTFQNQGMEVWNKLKVPSESLILWHANLRIWINQTVLERLTNEINAINEALHRHGFPDIQIGSVGLERLRKTAQTQQALQYIPTFSSLIPFLEITTNQEYLVKRIKQLASGGSMGEFRWNSGGSFNGKKWEDNLPTDSAIVMHLFATYLDTQLVPLPQQPDARPFSTRHIIKGSEKPNANSASVLIHQVTEKPPHYNLIVEGVTQEITKGRNNLFHALLLFLYYQNEKEQGMIGRVNLGRSGVNMLWIIQK